MLKSVFYTDSLDVRHKASRKVIERLLPLVKMYDKGNRVVAEHLE